MTPPPGSGQLTPWLYLGALGCLSLASVFFTYSPESLPGVVGSDRTPVSASLLRSTQEQLQEAFAGISDWSDFCRDPQTVFSQLQFEGGRQLKAFFRDEQRWEFPQRERDAWSRCQPNASVTDGLRYHFCFHLAAPKDVDLLWSSPLNLLELNMEFYAKGIKKPLRCQDIAGSTQRPEELVLYYSAYWAYEQIGQDWQFERLADGLRLPIQWQPRQASAR